MSNRDLLIEIGLEEMPAKVVTASINQFATKVENWLSEKKISFHSVKTFSTPRRLALVIKAVVETQEDNTEEAKGPAKKIALDAEGNWSKAAIGFTRGQGVSVEDIFFKEINGIDYAHVIKFTKGQQVVELLPELKEVVTGLTFPKNMRWANQEMRYVRPIKWIVALFGQDIIPMSITTVESGKVTQGHRFLGETVVVDSPSAYEQQLEEQFVIVDSEKRKSMILSQLKALETKNGWTIPVDEDLLEEVNNLVEFPTALFGSFEEEFLELPDRVLITSMKEHQRYFPVKDNEGKLLPHFVTVRNGNDQGLEIVAKGNEKVLRARLADAAFFYREDQKSTIEASLKKLETIVYHEEIGTIAQKVERVRSLAGQIGRAQNISEAKLKLTDRAAQISKFDLVTNMVYEFPELQGYMGERYARMKGEEEEVAVAINEHYMPRHAEDSIPHGTVGALVSIAEKLDTIVSCFAIGIIPTGSQDPYALRRQASGIVQILLEKRWSITIEQLLKLSLGLAEESGLLKNDLSDVYENLISFFKARVKHLLSEKGIRYDLIDAMLENEMGHIHTLVEKAQVLEEQKNAPDFKGSMEALSRVMNIAVKRTVTTDVNPDLFDNEYEKGLYQAFESVKNEYYSAENEEQKYRLLLTLKEPIENYFEHTMVMAENEEIRNNRLSFMHVMSMTISSFAAMNKILTA
ncbi:glycine--tRNA ligase subunit beta [Peribacillus alkalitolerans]|uniref:glycine--tRNA ligase subunit beta n=1 Tax=Peribacillus alkalitolerans TaxID=1550385 RepID=UPI0013D322AB|nr:glycine--tRNA ligase subunit beta [Peribacillus alkalitolerans]